MSNQVSKFEPSEEYLVRFLSDWKYREEAFRFADEAINDDATRRDELLERVDGDEILAELVTYLATSKKFVQQMVDPVSIGIVFAVWREARRLQPRTEQNPTGEDALRAKVSELDWLFRDTPVSWTLYVVDDECPEGSLDIAKAIIEEEKYTSVEVLRLRDALPSKTLPLEKLETADLSVKGGAILLGMQRAAADQHDYVMYTDCDNSNNLGQIGLLLQPLLNGVVSAAIGDRRSTRVSHWRDSRESETSANYMLKRVRQLLDFDLILRDVTCPFKLFTREFLLEMLTELDVFDFCVDYDILGYVQFRKSPIAVVPIVSLDSDAETTWIALSNANVWWQKLKGFVHVVDKYNLPHNKAAADLVRTYLSDLHDIEAVLRMGEEGVVLAGRPVSPAEQLNMSLADVDEWLRSVLVTA